MAGRVPRGSTNALKCEPGNQRASLWGRSITVVGGGEEEAAWGWGRVQGPALQGLLSPVQGFMVVLRTKDSHQMQRRDTQIHVLGGWLWMLCGEGCSWRQENRTRPLQSSVRQGWGPGLGSHGNGKTQIDMREI